MADHCEGNTRRVLIVGGGPAGLSAGLWLHNLGIVPTIVEKDQVLGGALRLNFLKNNWVLGLQGMTGVELAAKYADHADNTGLDYRIGCLPQEIRRAGGYWHVTLNCDDPLAPQIFSSVIVATGTCFRGREILAGIQGSHSLLPHQLAFGPYAFTDLEKLKGKHVAIIGGGDNAFENARFLLNFGAHVTLLVRSAPRAQAELLAAVSGHPACKLLQPASLVECRREDEGILLKVKRMNEFLPIEVDRLHILAGYTPNTTFLDDLFRLDPALSPVLDDAGYLVTDALGRTSTPGWYGAGDVCNPKFPSVVSALSDGARVAKTIEADLRC